jgi:mono/diheme cytochrome c family protein
MSLRWMAAASLALAGLASPTQARAADADGAVVYRQNCVACHGSKADGKGPAAAALRPPPTDFTKASFWEGRTDEQVAASIRAGRPGTPMMPYASLSDAELSALVIWLRSQSAG